MRICHYEDATVQSLEPLCLTRPVYDLICGIGTVAHKQRRYFHADTFGVVLRNELAPLYRLENPLTPINDRDWLGAGPILLVNGRWLPPLRKPESTAGDEAFVAMVDHEVAYLSLPESYVQNLDPLHLEEEIDSLRDRLPQREVGGHMLHYLWEYVDFNAEQIEVDFRLLWKNGSNRGRPASLQLLGPSDALFVDPTARIDPMVVVDTSNGPVLIDRDVVITSFSYLEGPCTIGARTQLFRATIRAGTTLGPNCRIGGELEASVIQGNTNKYHDGFLGHSYLGEWVNIAAGTQTSNLRNDYGEVRVPIDGAMVATGRNKVGCFLGDYSQTGLGCLLNSGTHVGVFGNLLPTGNLLPKYVPSFCSVEHGQLMDLSDLEGQLRTASRMMECRGEVFTDHHARWYEGLYRRLAGMRRLAIQEADRRRFRRSA